MVPGATGGPNPPAQLNRIFFRSITIAGTTMGTRGELRRLVDLMATGALRPLIGSTHPLRDAAAAFADMAPATCAARSSWRREPDQVARGGWRAVSVLEE